MIAVPVTEPSQVADARRRAVGLARDSSLPDIARHRLELLVTELATNILKYAAPGEILMGAFEDDTGAGIEILALDKGVGIARIDEALRDGHSTGGGAGSGLGAVKRLADMFDIVSWPQGGTAILARIVAVAAKQPDRRRPTWATVAIPLRGEFVSGDGHCGRHAPDGWTILVADGLGHGPHAARAADEAIRIFRQREAESLTAILEAIHAGLRATRGAAVSIARLDATSNTLSFAGIGNVAGAIVTGAKVKRMVVHAGTAGQNARRIQIFDYPFSPESFLVMHSDGLSANWSLDTYPGLGAAHPSLIAGILYRDFARVRDDATVLVATRGAHS